jgi:GT2 family glycosyltransferase
VAQTRRKPSPKIGPSLLRQRVAWSKTYGLAKGPLDLSLAVVSYNQWPVSQRFIQSLGHPQAPARSELLWVDNGSTDGSAKRLKAVDWTGLGGFSRVTVLLLKRNYFISGAVNTALAAAKGRYFIQADNDVLFAPDSLTLYLHAMSERPGALLSPLWQLTQGLLPLDFEPACYGDLDRAFQRIRHANGWLKEEHGSAAGSCWGSDTATLKALGGWSEDYKLQCMDDDMILRWRESGRPAGMLPLAVFHPGLKTRRADRRASDWELADAALFKQRWQGKDLGALRAPRPLANRLLSSPVAKVIRALRMY